MKAPVIALLGRLHRREGVRVLVPLDPRQETVFLEDGEALPPNLLHIDLERKDGDPGPSLALREVLEVLWPGGHARTEARLLDTLALDNRLDLEERLGEWARLLRGLIRWWQALPSRRREPRNALLHSHAPRLAMVLELILPVEDEPDLEKVYPGIFLTPSKKARIPDEEDWAGWKSRDVAEILGPAGGLAQLLGESFESRQGQIDMAERVARVQGKREHLMVEAGTGIGKSLAYLIPSLLIGAREEERVVISTYTKALQHQLIQNDLPLLERFGYPGHARLLLGRSNYLCTRQLRRALLHRPEDRAQALAQLALFCWRHQSEDGRREELSEHPFFEEHWLRHFESVEPCSPHICHRDPPCFVVKARRLAREAPVVVVNHSLLMMDLRSAQGLLGPSRLLVVDEAHELPPVATSALSHWIRRDRLEVYRNLTGDKLPNGLREVLDALVRSVQGKPGTERLVERTQELDQSLDAWLNAYARWFDAVDQSCLQRLGEGAGRVGRHRFHDGAEAFGIVRSETTHLFESAELLHRRLAAVLDSSADFADLLPELEEEREGLASLLSYHSDLVEAIRFCVEASDEDWVYWFEWGGSRGLRAIVGAPLTVEEPLAALWDQHFRSVVMTSATLAVGDDFLPFAESVGFSQVSRYTDTLLVPSPFEFEEQALVLTTPDLVDPKDDGFAEIVAELLQRIGQGVETKTLMLSTSYSFIDQVHELLRPVFGDDAESLFDHADSASRPVLLRQTPAGSRERLISNFREAKAAILLATGSFWEGVDFPGRELEVLVVPRLPFAVPTEPLIQGRYDRARRLGRDPFQDVALADAVLRLKQGVGRLLRTREDRGVVLLLDLRLQQKDYGMTFLKSMPRTCEWVPSREELADRVVEFLKESTRAKE